MDQPELVAAALTPTEARSLTEEVKADAVNLWTKLLRLYNERAHTALGYKSWGSYYEAEFGKSRAHSYRLLEAARVSEEFVESPIGDSPARLNEGQARELARIPDPDIRREVWQSLTEEHDKPPTGKEIHEYVEERRAFEQAEPEDDSIDSDSEPPLWAPAAGNLYIPPPDPVKPMDVHFSSASPDWNTPPEIVTRVLRVMNAIDLDPCSNSHSEPSVPSEHRYTREDDGLVQPWQGRVYMNPPYGDEIGAWVRRLWMCFAAGDVTEAIALLPARTDTQWFQSVWKYAERVCFIEGRLKFSGHENSAPFPSALAYFGANGDRFAEVMVDLGAITTRALTRATSAAGAKGLLS